jgi:hypothetical protein
MAFADFIKGAAENFLKKSLFSGGNEIIYRARLEMRRFQRKMIKTLVSVFILLLAFASLALAGVFYLTEYAHLTRTLAFLILGIVLLLIGVILKI